MKIWLLENGERTGPHEIYTIRDRISNDELQAGTPAWYEGADGWVTLGEVPAYSYYFNKSNSIDGLAEEEKLTSELIESLEKELENTEQKPLPLPLAQPDSAGFKNEPLHPVRRFFARMIDISLYTVLLYIVKVQMGINPLVVESVAKELIFQVPYLILDGLALSYIGTTPGKWLLNIKLRRYDGHKLEISSSIIRSLRVWVMGFAMQTPFVLIGLPFSWFIASKYGKFLWDIPKNNITECKPLTPLKMVGVICLMMAAGSIMNYMIPPEFLPTMENYKRWNNI
ncbi:MAG: RDD family protein [Akkermansiaceae bacterium]